MKNKSEELKEQRLANLKRMLDNGVITKDSYGETVSRIEAEYRNDEEPLERPGKKLNVDF